MSGIQDKEIKALLSEHNLYRLKDIAEDLETRGLKEAAEATKLLVTRLSDIQSQLESLERSIGETDDPGSLRYVWRQHDYGGANSEAFLIEANKYFAEEQAKADMSA